MSFRRRLIPVLLVVALVLPNAARAATADNEAKAQLILLIDMQRILDQSDAAKGIQKQLETQRAKFQTRTEGEEDELRHAEDELNKARDQTAATAYADREQQLRQRFLTVERRVQARRKVLDQGFTDSMNAVRAALLQIVQDVAHERHATMVLVKQQALWADANYDITDEVLGRLNKKLPQVTVKLPSEDTE